MKAKYLQALRALIDNAEIDNLDEKREGLEEATREGEELLQYLELANSLKTAFSKP